MDWKIRIKSGFGYSWAVLCIVIILAAFVGMNFFAQTLARSTGLEISPWYSGGEVRRTFEHGDYRTLLRRPVFDGLLSDRSEGFVQIDWVPMDGKSLPPALTETLDVNGDGSPDLTVLLNTAANTFELESSVPWALGADHVIVAGQERILRVRLRNPAGSR